MLNLCRYKIDCRPCIDQLAEQVSRQRTVNHSLPALRDTGGIRETRQENEHVSLNQPSSPEHRLPTLS